MLSGAVGEALISRVAVGEIRGGFVLVGEPRRTGVACPHAVSKVMKRSSTLNFFMGILLKVWFH